MWSWSILVTTAMIGCKYKNEASDSSASATKYSPWPRCALVPIEFKRPPMTQVGSSPASPSTCEIKLVVVVLPCVPAMAMPCLKRISSASIIARGTTGTPAALAATTSGLSGFTALEITTTSAPAILLATWPITTLAPKVFKRLTGAFSVKSEPLT